MVIYYYYFWRWNNTYYPPCAMTNQPLRPKTPGVERSKGEGGGKKKGVGMPIRGRYVVRSSSDSEKKILLGSVLRSGVPRHKN